MTLTVGSLFSGIGGLELGFERAGFEVRWQVEIDEYARRVLAKHWPDVPKYEDVRDVGAHNLERVDVIVGGFPCQPVSYAGKRRVQADGRWLWPEFARVVRLLRPRYIVAENVTGILSGGFNDVLCDLAACGYDAEWEVIPACAFGAAHTRARVFVIAYPTSERHAQQGVFRQVAHDRTQVASWETTDAVNAIRRGAVPALCRSNHGILRRVDRLRGLGNAVVPAVAQYVAECVLAHHQATMEAV